MSHTYAQHGTNLFSGYSRLQRWELAHATIHLFMPPAHVLQNTVCWTSGAACMYRIAGFFRMRNLLRISRVCLCKNPSMWGWGMRLMWGLLQLSMVVPVVPTLQNRGNSVINLIHRSSKKQLCDSFKVEDPSEFDK